MPRDRRVLPSKGASAPAAASPTKTSDDLQADYGAMLLAREGLRARNTELIAEVAELKCLNEDLRMAKVAIPMTDLERALLAPHAPLIEWVREQQTAMEQIKKDICALDRAMRTMRDTGVEETNKREAEVVKDKYASQHSQEFRLKQMMLHDKSAGPPRSGMVWRPAGKGGMWLKPAPRYCWFCSKEVNGDYFCSASHAKKYQARHKTHMPMMRYRTRANMTFAEAGVQGTGEKDG
jgi:hypothetical protein